jgi:hypothetical protein
MVIVALAAPPPKGDGTEVEKLAILEYFFLISEFERQFQENQKERLFIS